jgi:hypothetical protein
MDKLDLPNQIREVDKEIPKFIKDDEYLDNFSRFLNKTLSAQFYLDNINYNRKGFRYEINVVKVQDINP